MDRSIIKIYTKDPPFLIYYSIRLYICFLFFPWENNTISSFLLFINTNSRILFNLILIFVVVYIEQRFLLSEHFDESNQHDINNGAAKTWWLFTHWSEKDNKRSRTGKPIKNGQLDIRRRWRRRGNKIMGFNPRRLNRRNRGYRIRWMKRRVRQLRMNPVAVWQQRLERQLVEEEMVDFQHDHPDRKPRSTSFDSGRWLLPVHRKDRCHFRWLMDALFAVRSIEPEFLAMPAVAAEEVAEAGDEIEADGIRKKWPNWRKSAALRSRTRKEFGYRTSRTGRPHRTYWNFNHIIIIISIYICVYNYTSSSIIMVVATITTSVSIETTLDYIVERAVATLSH